MMLILFTSLRVSYMVVHISFLSPQLYLSSFTNWIFAVCCATIFPIDQASLVTLLAEDLMMLGKSRSGVTLSGLFGFLFTSSKSFSQEVAKSINATSTIKYDLLNIFMFLKVKG